MTNNKGFRERIQQMAAGLLHGYGLEMGALRPFLFPASLIGFVAISMIWPKLFLKWGDLELRYLIVHLIQVITFGMGTTLNPQDFRRVLECPKPVIIGFFLQFTIMPLVGFGITRLLVFEPEIAAGIILVGCVSGGVASNLITYLAKGDVALSVTMTACSTILSPLVTPLLMKGLAGKLVPIHLASMMLEIINMILVPIIAGLVANHILYSPKPRWNDSKNLVGLAVLLSLIVTAMWFRRLIIPIGLKQGICLGLLLIALISITKLVMSQVLKFQGNWMDRVLSWVSMCAICLILGIITARSRDKLMVVGLLLTFAVLLHNAVGYLIGYGTSRLLRLNESTSRTVSIEVGMQNSGMASALAMDVLQSPPAALASAIFGPVMNLSGAILASIWKRLPPTR